MKSLPPERSLAPHFLMWQNEFDKSRPLIASDKTNRAKTGPQKKQPQQRERTPPPCRALLFCCSSSRRLVLICACFRAVINLNKINCISCKHTALTLQVWRQPALSWGILRERSLGNGFYVGVRALFLTRQIPRRLLAISSGASILFLALFATKCTLVFNKTTITVCKQVERACAESEKSSCVMAHFFFLRRPLYMLGCITLTALRKK